MLRDRFRAEDPVVDGELPALSAPQVCDVVEGFRRFAIWVILTAAIVAAIFAVVLEVRIDPEGTTLLDALLALLLWLSRIWWSRTGHQRIADAFGTVALAALGGMVCGAIAMLELRLQFPIADARLHSWDRQLGVDGIAIVRWQTQEANWLFTLMKPAYNYTLQIFFGGLVVLALLGDRVEAWRAALCFVGTLFSTCLLAIFVPAKGLGVWANSELFDQLPAHAMRSFWPHFDEFYYGDNPVLRLQVIDGVISFPSFHSIVGFMTFAMWRKGLWTRIFAGGYLAVMLLATLPGGGHYVVDLIGGLIVWSTWFAVSLKMERRNARLQATTGE